MGTTRDDGSQQAMWVGDGGPSPGAAGAGRASHRPVSPTLHVLLDVPRRAEEILDRVVFRGEHDNCEAASWAAERLESVTEVSGYPTALCNRSSEEGIDSMLEAEVTSGRIAGPGLPGPEGDGLFREHAVGALEICRASLAEADRRLLRHGNRLVCR